VRRLNGLSAASAVVTTVQSPVWIVAIGVRGPRMETKRRLRDMTPVGQGDEASG
jgi:hypothetical protein